MLRCCWRPVVQLGRPFLARHATNTHPPPHTIKRTRRWFFRHKPKPEIEPIPLPPPKNPLSAGPLAALHAFLAPANLAAAEPRTYTPKALHKLYLAVNALPRRPKGHPLTVYELNELLVLFGSLSVLPPRSTSVHVHSFVSRLSPAPFRTYWPLVLELAEQIRMRPQRASRSSAHHYWVMRAYLASMRKSPGGVKEDPADLARAHYKRIRKTNQPLLHFPYLGKMLAFRRPTHLPQIVGDLCAALEAPQADHRLTNLLWNLVLGAAVPTPIQARVLAMLWTRLERHPYPSPPRDTKLLRNVFYMRASYHPRPYRALTIPHLCAALATALFPHFNRRFPAELSRWAAQEARAVFSPDCPPAARWDSLVVLALCAVPKLFSSTGITASRAPVGVRESREYDGHTTWRTVFALAMFERTVPQGASDSVATAVRRLWLAWKDAQGEPPPFVRRVVVGAFFRLAARTRDGPLKDGCVRYCVKYHLWGGMQRDVVQTTNLLVDYVFATMYTTLGRAKDWLEIFETLPVDSVIAWRARVADALLRELLSRDVMVAYGLYTFCEKSNLTIPADSRHALAVALARRYYPTEALMFLNDAQFSPDQTEVLLEAILRTLLRERHTFRDLPLADTLLPATQRLYLKTGRTPATSTKFPLRYALRLLADSERPTAAVQLLRILDARQPSFFSQNFYLRMMRILVRRHKGAAVQLLRIVHRFPARARQNFRRKLALQLARSRAHTLAAAAYRFGGTRQQPRTVREQLARAVGFRVNRRDEEPPIRRLALRIKALMGRARRDVPTARYGVALLARVGRIRAAKLAVLSAYRMGMEQRTITWLGNTVLNGALHRTKSKNARAVRHVLNNHQQLAANVDFLQDRVTVNILVKMLLRWRKVMDGAQIRMLFDHLVRGGYPVPARWRERGRVPFGTTGAQPGFMAEVNLQRLSPFISFQRHVRPLYRMFIKALHLQKDHQGARVVLGILHDVEDEVMARRHERARARLAGIKRKKTKLAVNKIK